MLFKGGKFYYYQMMIHGICHKLLALTASYVIAIQAVLFGLAPVTAEVAGSFGVLCSTENSGGAPEWPGHSKSQHDGICCLLAGCSAPAFAAPACSDTEVGDGRRYFPAKFSPVQTGPDDWPSERPRSSRAPPV